MSVPEQRVKKVDLEELDAMSLEQKREYLDEARRLIEEVYQQERQRWHQRSRMAERARKAKKKAPKRPNAAKRESEPCPRTADSSTLLEEGAKSLAFFCSYFLPHHFNLEFGSFHFEVMEMLEDLAKGKARKSSEEQRISVARKEEERNTLADRNSKPIHTLHSNEATEVLEKEAREGNLAQPTNELLILPHTYTYARCSCHDRKEGDNGSLPSPLNNELKERIVKGKWKLVEQLQADSSGLGTGGEAGDGGDSELLQNANISTPQNFKFFSPVKSERSNEINGLSGSTGKDGTDEVFGYSKVVHAEALSHALSHGAQEVSHGLLAQEAMSASLLEGSDDTLSHIPGTDDFSRSAFSYKSSILDRLAIAAPRGHAKSTLVSLGFVLWCVCYRLSHFILLISDSEDQSKMHLDAVKAELEQNEKIKAVFGNLVGNTWGELAVETGSGTRIQCRGTGQKIRGLKYRNYRPDLVIADDILNDELIETEERRNKLKRWFLGAVQPCLSIDGKMLCIGTILHQDDLLSDLLRSSRWESRIYDAEVGKDGDVLWPQAHSIEKLHGIRDDYAARGQISLYFREYRNQIVSNDEAEFQNKDFMYMGLTEFSDKIIKRPLKFFLTIDPAYRTEKRMDFSVFAVTAIDANNKVYVVEISRGRYSQAKFFDEWFRLFERYRPKKTGMQIQDWSRFYKTLTQDEMRKRQVFFNVTELQTYSTVKEGLANKKSRISRMSKYYASHSMIHISECPNIKEYESELIAHPFSRYDDIADAVSMSCDFWFPPEKKKIPKPYPKWLEAHGEGNPVSGY